MSDTTTLTLTYQNTGSAYDSMSISELRNTLDSLEMGTQEWFAVKAILENRENGTSTGNAFYDSMSDSELHALITQSDLGSQTNSDAVEAFNKRQEAKRQNKATEYDAMDYDDLKQIVTDSCMVGHPNLEAMEALSRADAAGKWKTSKQMDDSPAINNYTDINEMREYILDKINEYRAEKGRNLLELDDELNDYAQVRAEEADVKFSHTRPDGSGCLDELQKMYPNSVMNENLATGYSYKVVAERWYGSKGHKKNMLNSKIDKCGLGIYNDTLVFIGLQDK